MRNQITLNVHICTPFPRDEILPKVWPIMPYNGILDQDKNEKRAEVTNALVPYDPHTPIYIGRICVEKKYLETVCVCDAWFWFERTFPSIEAAVAWAIAEGRPIKNWEECKEILGKRSAARGDNDRQWPSDFRLVIY